MTHTVAALCFLPDTGHVMPLLRLARLVGRHQGARVVAFLPARFEQAATESGCEFRALEGLEHAAGAPVFAALARRSVFYTAFSYDQDLLDGYWAGLHEAAARELGRVAADLEAMQPELLLTDSHVFAPVYRLLAAHCGATLAMSRAVGGTMRYQPRPFMRAYGLSRLPRWWQRAVEIGGGLHARVVHRWRRHVHPGRARLTEARVASLQARARELFGSLEPAREQAIVTAGIAAIEHRVAQAFAAVPDAREVLLAPMIDAAVAPLPAGLESWLANQPRGRVVYVGFGTMVRPHASLLRRVLDGLRAAQVSVLWAQPLAQRGWLEGERLPESVRFEEFAPQASLLVASRVDAFVTHAGLGAVQEALLGGVPMLCIPFLWDQPYLSSVVERLGAGLRRFPATLTRRQVTEDVGALLGSPAYRERASEIAGELRNLKRAPAQTAWIDSLFRARGP